MGQVLVTESHLQDMADAIRAKYGSSTKYTPANMASAILSMRIANNIVVVGDIKQLPQMMQKIGRWLMKLNLMVRV